MTMQSHIYEGTIRHRRFRPVPNSFRYRLFFMYLDLSELPAVFDCHPLWSSDKFNIAWFRRRDHFGDPKISLAEAVGDIVEKESGSRPRGPIRLLTHLRYFGHCFNPASIYYCFDPTGQHVETIVVEIHNTPWSEVHCYVLPADRNEHPLRGWQRYRFEKAFHVSPFIDMNIRYDWRFREPGDRLNVHMIDFENGTRIFDASLVLERKALDRRSLTHVLVQYPFLTVKVIGMIYWQALRLIIKKVPFFTHPNKRAS